MKKLRAKKAVVIIAVLLIFIAVYLFYSRPMTIQQRYPTLTLDKCSGMSGYYEDGTGVALKEFTIDKNSEDFELLCDLLYEQEYHRSLRDLLPRSTRIHRTEPGDSKWEVYFHFEDVVFPDGSTSSGKLLRIESWYGDLDIYFDEEVLSCYTNEQEEWAKEVLNIIQHLG